ncbi:uncharacterized protein LOC102804591 [Saccoglossus kowalevskii]|uniref:Uncharacterized protein LOC102804591 n=1 Tax=Saccoglossus kowalevskii TaxID=10224 RepID=A0ABM0MD76_SACKO|nr:PREDICTED: uncharacterized protein LOC102804591 [Saccoglossus kowalevskii]
MTIPRLELKAATLSVKQNKLIQRDMEMKVDETFYWTDSMTVLRYINNEHTRYHTFVANRVALIRDGSVPEQWSYVNTKDSPANECSLGQSIDDFLNNSRWIYGPRFIWESQERWPQTNPDTRLPEDDQEVKTRVKVNTVTLLITNPIAELIQHYSNWFQLRKAVAWLLKFKKMLKIRCENKHQAVGLIKQNVDSVLTVQDMCDAELAIIKFEQHRVFA